ncbi:MAG: hypothetical protein ACHRXM_32330 [Isosphaerales bacterium]
MNVRILSFVVLFAGFLPNICWGQTPIPMRDGNGTTWWHGPRGITPGPAYTPRRTTPHRPQNRRIVRRPVQISPSQFPVLSDREFFAPNLGIHFKLVRVGGAAGAKLTRTPPKDAGVSNILVNNSPVHLEPDDVIYNLDSLPIREAVDVMNHHGQTVVSFIDCRTGRAFAGVMALPSYTPLPDDVPKEIYAENLGMHYQLLASGDGAFGARLSRTARPNTPAGALRLERGDMITRLDGHPIHGPEDVLNHFAGTSVEFVNIRNGVAQSASVQLPDAALVGSPEGQRLSVMPQ